jgi:hypothetical protein
MTIEKLPGLPSQYEACSSPFISEFCCTYSASGDYKLAVSNSAYSRIIFASTLSVLASFNRI